MSSESALPSLSLPVVQVVIPTWNGRNLLHYPLDSLARQAYRHYTVTVVDNGSTDGTIRLLSERWPDVSLIRLRENTGFAHATNCGIRAGNTDLVALLNNDVELHPQWLTEMVTALLADPGLSSVTGRMLSWRDPTRIDNLGLYCLWNGDSNPIARNGKDGPAHRVAREVFGACAGAALYRRDAFDAVGFLDADFFAYSEDADWAFRAQLLGWRCRYVPDAVSYHLGSSTSEKMGRLRAFLSIRNSVVMILKTFPSWALLRHSPRILWRLLAVARTSVRSGNGAVYVKALLDVVASGRSISSKRRAIQTRATASRAQLESVMGYPELR